MNECEWGQCDIPECVKYNLWAVIKTRKSSIYCITICHCLSIDLKIFKHLYIISLRSVTISFYCQCLVNLHVSNKILISWSLSYMLRCIRNCAPASSPAPSGLVTAASQHSVTNDKAQHLGLPPPFTYFIVFCCLFYSLLQFSLRAKLLPISHNDMMSVQSFICHLAPNLLTNCWFLCHDSCYYRGCSAGFPPESCRHYGMLKV